MFYIRHLFSSRSRRTLQERYEMPYYDYLQAPLQPLMDNLGNCPAMPCPLASCSCSCGCALCVGI
jgi:hypothetical protein